MKAEKLEHIFQLIVTDLHEKVDEAHTFAEQNREDVNKELQLLLGKQEYIQQLTDKIFPEGIRVDRNFYSRISNAHYCLGREKVPCQVLGNVWAEVYRRLTHPDGEKLLELLPEFTHDIFSVLSSLPEFLSHTGLREEFAASWFLSLGSKIANDLANGPFFDGVYEFAMHFPSKGVQVLEIYKRDKLDGFRVGIAAAILAASRTCIDNGSIAQSFFKHVEDDLRRHPNISYRHAYNLSWIGYFRGGTVSADVLINALSEMTEWSGEDVDDAFWVLSRCILSKKENEQFLRKAFQWIKSKANPSLPKGAKYALVDLAYQLRDILGSGSGVSIAQMNELLLAIQPLTKEEKGALKLLQLYLAVRLKNDKEEFRRFLGELVVRSPELLPEAIREHECAYLLNQLSGAYGSSLITELLLSKQVSERRLGRALLEEVRLEKLDEAVLKAKGSVPSLSVLLLEIARRPFSAELTSRIFLLLLPFYETTDTTLRKEFVDEMVFQAINFPGACYQAWKDHSSLPPALVEVLEQVKTYFDGLDSLRSCSGGHLTFPEWNSALKEWERRFSNEVSEGAKKASIFASLVRHIDLIYGSEWSIADTSKLSDPSPMTTFSHGMEVPRVEILDPEGCAIRRLRFNSLLRKLQGKDSPDFGKHE
ncbi:MAG: hypothetical protein LZF62_480328 [Nitrospira sp.]|nr:MAG: hypothetical protein LZF62_480328 [Nitrospira sp.]